MSSSTNQATSAFSSRTPSPAYLQESKAILAKAFQRVRRTAPEVIEIGKRLILLKEVTAHGDWAGAVESVGVSRRLAEKMMRIARRFTNLQNLVRVVTEQSRLFEVERLDDKELVALDAGKTVRGLNLETIENLTVAGIRRALKDDSNVSSTRHLAGADARGREQQEAPNSESNTNLAISEEPATPAVNAESIPHLPKASSTRFEIGDTVKAILSGRAGVVSRICDNGTVDVVWGDDLEEGEINAAGMRYSNLHVGVLELIGGFSGQVVTTRHLSETDELGQEHHAAPIGERPISKGASTHLSKLGNAQAPNRASTPDFKSKPDSIDGLQPLQAGDRIKSLYAGRDGSVVRTYADGSVCVLWDDGEPQYEGLGHERVPRHMLAFVEHSAITTGNESDGDKFGRQTQESGENDLAAESLSPVDIRGLAQDIARQLNGTAADPAESQLNNQPASSPETCPAVYDMRRGSFNGAELSILQHEGRAWLILEEIAAVVGDTPEKVAAIEAAIGECFDLNFPSGHYATVRFASTSLTARILDVHAVCFLEEALGAEFVQWFSGQCRAMRPAIQPAAQPEEPQRADYLDQLRELHYELYNMKCLIASQAKAIQVMGDDLQDEKVYPLVDLSKIAIGLTDQLDALLDRHDEVLTRLRTRLLKKPGDDDTLPESVWLGLVEELSAEREGWGNEDMWRLSQQADCLSRYAVRSPEASAALRHLKAFAARQGAVLYDHLYEGELPGEGRMAFSWLKGVAPQRGRESIRAH